MFSKSKLGLFGLALLFLGLWKLLTSFPRSRKLQIQNLTQMQRAQRLTLIYNEIVQWVTTNTNISLRGANYIAAIAAHETGVFSSAIFRENRNLFGMKQPARRDTLALGTSRGHAVFSTYQDNITDFIFYLQHFRNNPDDQLSLANWVHRLKHNNYFEDTLENYYRGSRSHLQGAALSVENLAVPNVRILPLARTMLIGWSTPVILKK